MSKAERDIKKKLRVFKYAEEKGNKVVAGARFELATFGYEPDVPTATRFWLPEIGFLIP